MKKQLQIAATALLAGSLAWTTATVSAANHVGSSTTPPKLKTGVTLHVWDYFDSANKTDKGRVIMQRIADQWGKATHNTVVFDGHPTDSQKKMCQAAPSGQGPDLIGSPHDQVSIMVACKVLAPVPAWAWSPGSQKTYIKAATQATRLEGKVYSMPWAIETTGLWYNKSLIPASTFKSAPGKPLAWSKLLAQMQKINDLSAGKYAFGWDINNFYFDYAFLSNTGGYVFKFGKKGYDYNNVGLDNAGAIKGLTFIRDLTTAGKYKLVPTSMTGSTAKGLFDSGKMAVYLTGPWDKQDMVTANLNFGFAPIPSIDGKHAAHPFSGVQVYSVNKYSKHTNEALSLLAYVTKNMQLPEFKQQGRLPVIKSVLASKTVTADKVSGGLASAALSAAPMPNIPEMGQVWTPMADALSLVTKGSASPADAAHAAANKIKSDIAKAHGG